MLNVECFFMVCSARALSNGCKSRVSPNSGNYIAKGKVKAQKLQKQHALKGQKLLAQGSALGIMAISKTPCKGKSFVYCQVF
mgnify:CR=1